MLPEAELGSSLVLLILLRILAFLGELSSSDSSDPLVCLFDFFGDTLASFDGLYASSSLSFTSKARGSGCALDACADFFELQSEISKVRRRSQCSIWYYQREARATIAWILVGGCKVSR